jgi:hypothetical protein
LFAQALPALLILALGCLIQNRSCWEYIEMIVTAWNNGKHHKSGAGYGLKLTINDREKYFHREWYYVIIRFGDSNQETKVNIKKLSFWGDACRELINIDIGKWFLKQGMAPWPKGLPPKLRLEPISGNMFLVVA